MINRTKVKESTQIKPGDNGDVLVMKGNAPEWSTPSDAGLAEQANVDSELSKKQDKLVAGDNIHIDGNTISADGKPTPINIGTVISGEVPMVSNSGTDTDVILNFVLPKGDKGDKGDQGIEGPQGPVGAPFQVKKIYDSVEAMNADYSGSDVAVGEFVLIDTGNVEDPDNSKLYVKGPTQYDFVTDLSGAQGIQGPQGNPGAAAGFGNVTATVDNTTGTPQVSVQSDGPNTAKNIAFNFSGLKGEKGDKGDPGKDGTQVNIIAPLTTTSAVESGDDHSLAIGPATYSYSGNKDIEAPYSIAIGKNINATGGGKIIGDNPNDVQEGMGIVIGSGKTRVGTPTGISIGHQQNFTSTGATNNNFIAIGDMQREAKGAGSISIGRLVGQTGSFSVAIGDGATCRAASSVALGDETENFRDKTVSVGSRWSTRAITGVADPTEAQDAATKNYVDTQLTPITAKLQYVPDNTNQILSQIQTNVEKAQSAADAKVASITAGTGISVDASNPTAPVVSTTGLATQADLTTLQTTVAQLQATVTQLQTTINNLTLETERI